MLTTLKVIATSGVANHRNSGVEGKIAPGTLNLLPNGTREKIEQKHLTTFLTTVKLFTV